MSVSRKAKTALRLLLTDRRNLARVFRGMIGQVKFLLRAGVMRLTNEWGRGRTLLIDCGANVGDSFDFFRRWMPEGTDFILIEPNPNCAGLLRRRFSAAPNIKIIEAAAWTKDTQLTLSVSNPLLDKTFSEWSHVGVPTGGPGESTVEAIDFVDLVRSIEGYDRIICKMDIEGSEYPVLTKLINDGVASKLNVILVEFHRRNTGSSSDFTKRQIFEHIKGKAILYEWR